MLPVASVMPMRDDAFDDVFADNLHILHTRIGLSAQGFYLFSNNFHQSCAECNTRTIDAPSGRGI